MARPAVQRRGDRTRLRVIEAAIQAFGMDGFERTSTRAVVERAGTNLVAIHYHFGSKRALYCAAAEHIASAIQQRSESVTRDAHRLARDRTATRAMLVDGVCVIFDEFAALALGRDVPESWRRFIAREQADPTSTGAFELIFGAVRPFFESAITLMAKLLGRSPADPDVRLLALMIFGQILVFRLNRRGALRLLGWTSLGARELRTVQTVARSHILRLLDAGSARPTARRGPIRPHGRARAHAT